MRNLIFATRIKRQIIIFVQIFFFFSSQFIIVCFVAAKNLLQLGIYRCRIEVVVVAADTDADAAASSAVSAAFIYFVQSVFVLHSFHLIDLKSASAYCSAMMMMMLRMRIWMLLILMMIIMIIIRRSEIVLLFVTEKNFVVEVKIQYTRRYQISFH